MGSAANGGVSLRKTNPALYRATMVTALASIALAMNFYFLTPTFPVWGTPYAVWGSIFLLLGVAKLVYLNVRRNLRLARILMSSWVGYLLFFGLGTMQPWLEGEGSLQLPIVYVALALIVVILFVLEPLTSAAATAVKK